MLLLLFQDSMHSAKQLMYIWLNSTKSIARGSGGMPQKNLKIKPAEIESEGIFNGLLPGLLQSSTLQNNYRTAIWLSSRLHYLSKELHYLTEGLHYHNEVNLKGTLLDMNHITTLRIQSMNIIIC